MGGRVQINNLSREGGNSIEIRPVVSEQKSGSRQLTNGNTCVPLTMKHRNRYLVKFWAKGLSYSRMFGTIEQDVLGMTLFSI